MRKIVSFMHVSLDGFVAGPNGEMNWIKVDEELFEYASNRTSASDTALYGRNTFLMMDNYWPTAADKPNASKHDIEHGTWYNKVNKYVVSSSIQSDNPLVTVISRDMKGQLETLKNQPGKEIIMFGSPGLVHSLLELDLIDEFWLFYNPILLGKGVPMFGKIREHLPLKLIKTEQLKSTGVVCMNYERVR
ncbi:dihydrofolate reductase family protein [Chitinophaga terrae (ex Kim and Jung 2007)]|nr:dihydrofolate reductase family protein [Chitinophaga terrae (ex Kim and Jung 2007)]MDQ0106233.1 dihydrofolate reductase [Chitinophaga terrae (ex Kim and Jung 2007)]GEP92127.1 hypothetical protein CTE07_37720 [Chitinophaga terrae (ex Kim and Jung 2007)]